MSIAELEARIVKRIVKPNDATIVTLDIERFPGAFSIDNWRGLTVEGEFWDLGQYRRTIGRRIQPHEVTRWPRTICLAWRRYGQKRVQFASEWGDGAEEMLRKAWQVYDEADIIQGHNIDAFDTKKLKGEWWRMGLPAPRPFKSVDTLKIARREFGEESNTLDSLVKRLGGTGKTDKYDVELARRALDGDKEAQRQIRAYNEGDIDASEYLADSQRGWAPNLPFIGTHGDEKRCNQCGSDDLKLDETARYRAVVLDYALYRCGNCGANVRGGWVARAASTRGAR